MPDQYLMAMDAGGGAGRCFLIRLDGQKAFSTYREWGYLQPAGVGPMGSAFDPDTFWATLVAAARDAMDKAGIRGDQVVAISSTSQREGCVFLDHSGKELYAGPNRDMRAVVEGLRIAGEHAEEIYRRSGHFPSGIFAPARLLWLKKNLPETFARVAHLQMINDWILWRLCGEYACEPSNASETCLYDLKTGDWMWDMIKALDLPKESFPQILPSGTRLGALRPSASAELGLPQGTPVVMGGADTQCGLLGCGTIHPGEIAAVCGTTTPVQMVLAQATIDPETRLWTGAHVVPGTFVLESNAGGSGSVYQWYRDSFCDLEVAFARARGGTAYDYMNDCASQAPPGSAGVQSFIGVMRFHAKTISLPPNRLELGLAPMAGGGLSSKSLVLRALLESLAFAIRMNADQILPVARVQPVALGVCGGLTNSSLYLEILANVMKLPVRVPRWKEGTAVGAAICAGVGCGVFRDFEEAARTLVQLEREVCPADGLSRQYQSFYKRWVKAWNTQTSTSPGA